ncbi:MAG: geranylgeranyl reductase, partial [Bacteroidetes bacterium]|nr:geranylgeranyl reductase [Bacteroidota bacterium]
SNNFSAEALKAYDARINRRFSQEFKTMAAIQYLAGSAWLFNLVVDKARKNKELSQMLTAMFTDDTIRKKLTQPGFYARLLFK